MAMMGGWTYIMMIFKKGDPPWSILDAAIILVIMVVAGTITGFVLASVKSDIGVSDITARFFLATIIQNGIVVLSIACFLIFKYHASFKNLVFRRFNLSRNFITGLGGGILLLVVVIITGALMDRLIPGQSSSPQPYARLVLETNSKKDLFLALFAGIVIAPTGEALYFRGCLFNVLKSRLGWQWGIVLASLVFAAMHFDLVRFIPLALGGAGLAYLYHRTGSLLTSMVAHATWNLSMFMLILASRSLLT